MALELFTSSTSRADSFDLFKVDIKLTEKGENNIFEVQRLVYAYINNLRSQTLKQYVYQEKSRMADIFFENQRKTRALIYANELVMRMLKTSDEDMDDILTRNHAHENFDA